AALGRGGRGGGPSGLPADRHGDEHRARAGVPGEPAAGARARESLARDRRGRARGGRGGRRALPRHPEPVTAQFRFLSGARAGEVATFRKAYIGLGRHPLSDVRFDVERDLDVSSRHAAIVRHGAAFSVRDLGSKNGTFVNGARITGDVVLRDGDVIGFGPQGPSVEFRALAAEGERDAATAPREHRASAALRLVAELAHLRRTTKLLIGLLGLALVGFGWSQWAAARDARDLVALQARADSLNHEARRLLSRFQSELESVRDALRESQAEVARLRGELATAGAGSGAPSVARLRAQLDTADVGVLRVDVRGGTPRVLGLADQAGGLQRGDPVAIIGYPLGEDLPMERQGQGAVADPTLTVGTVSKVLSHVVQVDGYGAP